MVLRGGLSPDGEQRVITNSDEFAASQVTVGTTATLLAAANPNRKFLQLINLDVAAIVFVGASNVTTTTGHQLPPTPSGELTFGNAVTTAAVYGIVESGTCVVSVLEY
mgnify:CR=1 FL=1